MQLDAQDIVNQLTAQRNAAMDNVAQLAAMVAKLERELQALKEAQDQRTEQGST